MATSAVNLARLLTIRNDIKDAIGNKGVTIPSGTAFDDYPTYISRISGGGGNEPIYGVSGLYQSNPALTRTDDAVGMDFVINSSAGMIDSDFDNVFPWNETAMVTNEAGKFLRFPRMYFRVGVDSSHRITDVAVSKAPRGNGNWYEVEPFMYGCYGGSVSDEKLKSVSGVERQGDMFRNYFRSYAAANGTGYCLLDLYHRTVVMLLWFIEFATKKSDSIMTGRINGSGTQGGESKRPTGSTDNLVTPSGYETTYGQMRYHYIEDYIGNQTEYIEGVYCKNVGEFDYVTNDPANFGESTTGKSPLCYPVPDNDWVAALGWDNNNPFLCMPIETTYGDGTTFFCDSSININATNICLSGGAHYKATSLNYGVSCFLHNELGHKGDFLGARLIKIL